MAPYKPPKTLFEISVKSCVHLIYTASLNIKSQNLEHCDRTLEKKAKSLRNNFLMTILPARLFDILCSERACCPYETDPCLFLLTLFHPNIKVFRKCDRDNIIPTNFWSTNLPKLKNLVVLDLKFVCTDEILRVISKECQLLEEINIVSRVDIQKSPFNACVLVRNVSNTGIGYVSDLKRLRILAMDPPKNGRALIVGRHISQAAIVNLVNSLPDLVELKIESCDLGSTLITTDTIVRPLSLEKINCHFASANGVKKLIKICPRLKEFSFTHVTEYDKDAILNEISVSELSLTRLNLSFFSYSSSLQQLLTIKGKYLKHFSLCEIVNTLNIDAIIMIGTLCPNLESLAIMTQSNTLAVPNYFRSNPIFRNLKSLAIGNDIFDIGQILLFLFNCSENIQKLEVKYQSKVNIEDVLQKLLRSGKFNKLVSIWLDCTLGVSKSVIKEIIKECAYLRTFNVEFEEDMRDVQSYIKDNNLDIKLDGSY